MIAALTSRWQRLRESAEWRLTIHFFRAMFDFGILTEAGTDSFKHLLLGAVGGVITFGLLLVRVLIGRYVILWMAPSPEPYRRALVGDDMLIIALPMMFIAFITLLVSESLFPDERDFRILGPLPVPRSTVFATKLAGLLLFAGLFIAAVHAALLPWILLSSVNRWLDHPILLRLVALLIASFAASYFAVLAVSAVVGVLILAVPGGRLHTIGALMKSAVCAALVLSIPLVLKVPNLTSLIATGSPWLALAPPAWFLGLERVIVGRADTVLWQLAFFAVGGLALVALITAGTYLMLFRHFERLLHQPMTGSADAASRSTTRRRVAQAFSRPPAFRAITGFTLMTFARSQLHQSVLVGVSMFGVGIAINSLVGASPRSLARTPYWVPFVLMMVSGVAMRLSLSFPLQQRANWIFRVTEDDATRGDQCRAVDRVVSAWIAGVPAVASIVTWWIATGRPSLVAAAIVALIGLITVHWVLFDWRRIPFTCSYLPGKRFVAYTVMIGFFQIAFFLIASILLVTLARSSAVQAIIIGVILAAAAWWLRRQRLRTWRKTPLMFEDEFPDQPLQLQL